MLSNECLEMIAEWLYHNDKMKEINSILFNNTQFYEQRYMTEFRDDIFRFFGGKITRFTKDYNKIYSMLNKDEIKKLNIIKAKRR